MGTARYQEIAAALRQAIHLGEYPIGARLPSESELAARWSASRGTVRQAVALLATEGLIGSRQGARRVVLRQELRHSFADLYSFAQWARGMGAESTSRFLRRQRRPATGEEAARLAVPEGAEILHAARLRTLDGEPVMVERTAYPPWLAQAIEELPEDCVSIMDSLAASDGVLPQYGDHLIDAVAAGSEDARLLGYRRGGPLVRHRNLTSTPTGRPIGWSDDRYRAGSVSFNVSNAQTTVVPLVRRGDRSRPGRGLPRV